DWILRLRDGPPSMDTLLRWQESLAQDASHHREYARFEDLWETLGRTNEAPSTGTTMFSETETEAGMEAEPNSESESESDSNSNSDSEAETAADSIPSAHQRRRPFALAAAAALIGA